MKKYKYINYIYGNIAKFSIVDNCYKYLMTLPSHNFRVLKLHPSIDLNIFVPDFQIHGNVQDVILKSNID